MIAEDRDLYDEAAAVAVARGLGLTDFNEATLRTRQMGEAASVVAAMPRVRAALIEAQRAFAARPGGAVLDGRDIGTVICPNADVKIFVTASPAARAQRRALELMQSGERADYNAILADITRRNSRNSNRAVAPLRPADNSVTLDRTHLRNEAALSRGVADRRGGADTGLAGPVPPLSNDRRQSGGDAVGEAVLRRPQPLDRALDLVALPLQMADLGHDLLWIQLIFEIDRFSRPFTANQVLDFGRGEAELLALEDHFHPDAVGCAIVAGVPSRRGSISPRSSENRKVRRLTPNSATSG